MKFGKKDKSQQREQRPGERRAQQADIGLLLEGTFPYVAGGVSSWVNQMIRGFPDVSFAIVFIGSLEEEYGEQKYELPQNVVHFERHYLYEKRQAPEIKKVEGDAATFAMVEEMHRYFRAPHAHAEGRALFERLAPELADGKLNQEDFLYSHKSWDFLSAQYREFSSDPSFVDYFWTVRTMHGPIWILADIAKNLIPCKAYHTISTGYAGLLGALLKYRTGKPLILSEHGIYTKERRIDLFNAHWIPDNRVIFQRDPTEIAYFRQMWMRFFEGIGKICYDASDAIIALFEGNRRRHRRRGRSEPHVEYPQRHRHRPLRRAAYATPGEDPARTGVDRPRGSDQGHHDVHPRHADCREPPAGSGRLDHRAGGRGRRIRAGMP
jgi:polysaccharide biosynthesis protein PelF